MNVKEYMYAFDVPKAVKDDEYNEMYVEDHESIFCTKHQEVKQKDCTMCMWEQENESS